MYVHICRVGASSPSSRARCHAERLSAFWRSRDGAGACARSLTVHPSARRRMARPAAARVFRDEKNTYRGVMARWSDRVRFWFDWI